MSRLAVISSSLLSLTLLSCGGLDPCPGVTPGAKYQVTLGPLIAAGSAACASDWGFGEGATYTATIVDSAGADNCRSGLATLEGNSGWSFTLDTENKNGGGGELIEAAYTAVKGACSAPARIDIGCTPADCVVGKDANCRCQASLSVHGDSNVCPMACSPTVQASVTSLD